MKGLQKNQERNEAFKGKVLIVEKLSDFGPLISN